MWQNWIVIGAALTYIGALFLIASYGDRLRTVQRGRARMLIYPLSLGVYCTSWTFFGSVGFATRSGLDFLAIYLGPMVMIGLCTPLVLRIVQLAKTQNITSIADFIAARYGKSQWVAATVALIAIFGSIPYIALQLKAVSASLETILGTIQPAGSASSWLLGDIFFGDVALMVAISMATFAVLFGTRHTDATEHQDGLMLAIATESIIKLMAFVAVGLFVLFWMFPDTVELTLLTMKNVLTRHTVGNAPISLTFLTMTLLSFFAILLLPRQFHVTVVENYSPAEVKRAKWVFPLYLLAINLFVMPIAVAGLFTFPLGNVDSDMFVLSLPLSANSFTFAIVAFVGGLSAATAMVIVETVALAIMVSNDIIVPLMLQRRAARGAGGDNIGKLLLQIRRVAIFGILMLAYVYYRSAGSAQLAAIGLLSFAAVAQFAPAFFLGLIWRRGTARGAIAGMLFGFAMWGFTLLVPSFVASDILPQSLLHQGLFGIALLRPQALLGVELPPLVHGVFWSLLVNVVAYVAVSLSRAPSPIERLQADVFVPSQLTPITPNFRLWRSSITVDDLVVTVGQYLGTERTRVALEKYAAENRISLEPASPADFRLLRHAEHLIASAIGAASSRLVLSLLLRKRAVSAKSALKLLDDAHAAIHYNREILQTALDNVRQGLAVFNRELQLICSNRQFGELLDLPAHMTQLGIELEDILTAIAKRRDMNKDEIQIFVKDRLARYTAIGAPYLERFPRRNGVIEVRANRMPDSGYAITFLDITPSVEAAEALERANANLEKRVRERTEELTRLNAELARAKSIAEEANISKTRFLAAASHDILQPLNAARLYVTSLVERQHGGENTRLVHNIDHSLESIEEIIGALLDISRLDAGAMTASFSTFNINDLLRTLEVEFTPIARAKDLELRIMPCALSVTSDRALLRRLLQNLISNAIKYTPSGRVLVGCRRRGTSMQISIYDTGVGIPPSKRGEIFKEFHRLDQGARIARGLGLGLSIVERIARVLNHGITVDANRKGGSHFAVRLPMAAPIAQTLPQIPAPRLGKNDLSGALIMCIDNEPAILDGMRTLLAGWGAMVLTAPDLSGAIEQLSRTDTKPTGILVDYHLDRGTGIAVIRELRGQFGSDIPAVLITADRSPYVREAAREENLTVFSKPIKPAALRALLGQWRAQRMIAAE